METMHANTLDNVMNTLLALGCPMDIGIPAWIMTEMITRKTSRLSPEDVLGLNEEFREKTPLLEYQNKVGYQFSWGVLSEDINLYEDDHGDVLNGRFEILPKYVLQAFPQAAMVEDLFMWMYENHPLMSSKFDGDQSFGDWFVLSFWARGKDEIEELRHWLAMVFIPHILPDLLTNALAIIEEAKAVAMTDSQDGTYEAAMVERRRYQLCDDLSKLSFMPKM